jgi:hypothetical protein
MGVVHYKFPVVLELRMKRRRHIVPSLVPSCIAALILTLTNNLNASADDTQRTEPASPLPSNVAAFVQAPELLVRLAVAQNRHTPATTLELLAHDRSDVIRQAVASNPSCTEPVQTILRTDSNNAVLEALLRNPAGLSTASLLFLSSLREPKICETIFFPWLVIRTFLHQI